MRHLCFLSLLAACSAGLSPVDDRRPQAEILPLEGHVAGRHVLKGQVSDPDDPPSNLLSRWWVDGVLVCDEVVSSDDGTTQCQTQLYAGIHQLALAVSDPDGHSGEATLEVDLAPADAPEVVLNLPVADGIYYADEPIKLGGQVSDAQDPAEVLRFSWQSSLEGELTEGLAAPDGSVGGEVTLKQGRHQIALIATDTDELSGSATVSIEVQPANTAPSCALSGPDLLPAGTAAEIVATASDPDVAPTALLATLTSTLDGLIASVVPPADGKILVSASLSTGTHDLTLEVEDAAGARCEAAHQIVVSTRPTLTILDPWGQWVNEGELTLFSAVVEDADEAPETLTVTWTSDWDGLLSTPDATFLTDALSVNEHVITATVTDSHGLTASDTTSVSVNGRPWAPEITLVPTRPTTTDDLEVHFIEESVDPEADPITYTYTWYADGVISTASSTAVMPAQATRNRGQHWRVVVFPSDGRITGDAAEAEVTLANAPPVLEQAEIVPNPASATAELSCQAVTVSDPDGDDTFTYATSWTVNGTEVGPSLAAATLSPGDTVECTLTPSDGIDTGTAATASVMLNRPPVLSRASLSPADADTTDAIDCLTGPASDPEADPISFQYAWTVNGVVQPEAGPQLPARKAARDALVVCIVTPSDGLDLGAPVESAPLTIGNAPPAQLAVTLFPDPLPVLADVTCLPGEVSDPDGDVDFTWIYTWKIEGIPQGEDSNTLPAAATSGGQHVSCVATPHDGAESGQGLEASLTVNTPPTLDDVSIDPAVAGTNDPLSCVAEGMADADGHDVTLAYRWTVGSDDPGIYAAELPAQHFEKDDIVYCTVTPHDGLDAGTQTSSSAILIDNSPPALQSVTLTPDPASVNEPLLCTPGVVVDTDGEVEFSFAYTWSVGEGPAFAGSNLLPVSQFVAGDVVSCTAVPHDGQNEGSGASASVRVNTPPTVDDALILQDPAYTDTDLDCVAVGAFDADGDPISVSHVWTVEGFPAGDDTSTLSSAEFEKGDRVVCTVGVHDGVDPGDTRSSPELVVANTPPQIAGASVGPSPLSVNQDVTCTPGATSDLDADAPIGVQFAWFVDGIDADVSSAILSSSAYTGGETLTCRVTPHDGTDPGPFAEASLQANHPPQVDAVLISPQLPRTKDNLGCSAQNPLDLDGDTFSLDLAWHVGGTFAGAGAQLLSSEFSKGDDVSCTVTLDDGIDRVEVVQTVVIANTPPVLDTVELSPNPLSALANVTCTPGTVTDADNDGSFSFRYQWRVQGELQVHQGQTLTTGFLAGDTVECSAFPHDGEDEGAAASASIRVNTPPTLTSVSLTPVSPGANDALTCTANDPADVDGHPVTLVYAWRVGSQWISATGPLLDPDDHAPGQSVRCRVTPTDFIDVGVSKLSNTVTIGSALRRPPKLVLRPVDLGELFASADTAAWLPASEGRADVDFEIVEIRAAAPVHIKVGEQLFRIQGDREWQPLELQVFSGESLEVLASGEVEVRWQ